MTRDPSQSLELRHLRCFLAVADEANVTRAAARLGITQPAVSRTLAALETALGVRLVDRSTHHLELTAEGRAFRARAVVAVAAFEDAVAGARGARRPLRLGHAWSAAGAYTTPLLRRWRQEHPDVPLELLRIDDRTAGLAGSRVDVALLRGPVDSAELVTTLLHREARVAALPSDSPLARRATLVLADLADQVIALNTVSGTTTLELWPVGARPGRTLTVANTDDWLAAIAADRAVGVTSTATVALHPHPGVTYVPLTDAPPLQVHLAHHRGPTHPSVPDLIALALNLTQS
ncbi:MULTISPECIES: LysR family transcriptional regulator [unclassified Streptomyces]|uniref:LysR family transcriptional regulator n=1 Tax=unclassified Streptomyces TaxID=2593676 RepID=UPI000DB9EDAE|nr:MULTISPECIES: LysR family transcriptional regulator [unclassified Streptomyces]MYT72146.1 LysR family transcriptional regulator [Streptomyces sp. SID8367]RAJ81557.1 DNA-binding transcriptional LysR family regulator [Streptomyces sp. PsTaAH-137]